MGGKTLFASPIPPASPRTIGHWGGDNRQAPQDNMLQRKGLFFTFDLSLQTFLVGMFPVGLAVWVCR